MTFSVIVSLCVLTTVGIALVLAGTWGGPDRG